MRKLITPILAIVFLATAGCVTVATEQETGFLDRTLTLDGTTYRYVVRVPPGYDPAREWPLILFLHGSGERGTDGWRQTAVGLGAELRWNPGRVPAIVVMPQAPPETRWIGPGADLAMAALDRTIAELSVDSSRIYLTGLSLGGYGTWHIAMTHPDRFAALVPVCGGIIKPETADNVRTSPHVLGKPDPYGFAASTIAHVPVWMFHGEKDDIIPPSESRRMFEALKVEGAEVQYTEYPGVNHNAWDRAYGEQRMWDWLFSQRRRPASLEK